MAESQLNLTASIRIDTAKLDADIRIARAKMQQFNKQANADARESLKTGDTTAFQASSRAATQQEQIYQGLTRQKKEHLAVTNQTIAATQKESAAFRELSKYIIEFGKEAGISNLSVRGLKLGLAGLVVAEVIRGFAETTRKMNEMSISAHDLGTTVGHIKGFQFALRASGDDASKAGSLLEEYRNRMKNLSDQARDARIEMAETQDVFTETLAAGGTHAEASDAVNKAMERVRKTNPYLKAMERMRSGNADMVSAATDQLYGKGWAELQAKMPAGIQDAEEPTQRMIAIQGEYNKSVAEGVAWWEKVTEAIARAGQAMIVSGVTGALPGQTPTETATSTAGLGGYASGGYIRGAGGGTSDSILARLSNGEYVVNAASVRRLGVGYLDSLNATRFAAGGLVSAASSSGRPVHLHLGGSSFALSGSSGVVDALVSHAHSQQLRSAGVKPSWFAGRPGGR